MGATLRLPSIGTAYDVLLDNVEVKIVKEQFVAAVPATRVIYENDFSADMRNIENISADTELSTVSLNTTDNVLEINDSDAAGLAQFNLDLGESLNYNKKYLITYKARIVEAIDNSTPESPVPANHAKFIMRYDDVTKKYYSLASRITDENKPGDRSLLSLMVSDDLENWDVAMDVIDKRNCDTNKVGFQYTDFFIEDSVIYYLCRTAMNNANSFHDSNYSIFGKIDLRKI